MKYRKLALVATVAAVASSLLLAGCSSGGVKASPTAAPNKRGAVLQIANNAQPAGWDTLKATSNQYLPYYQTVYDTLLQLGAKGKFSPMLATSWKYDSSNTALTLKLRHGVTFTDGTAFNSAAVATNMQHLKTGNGSESSELAQVQSVSTPDKYTVVVHLAQPDPSLEESLAGVAGLMASPKAIAAGTINTTPVGTGMYEIDATNTVDGSTYTFDRNTHYWQPSAQKYDKVVWRVIPDTTALMNALVSGQLNAALLGAKQASAAKASGLKEWTWSSDISELLLYDKEGVGTPALKNVKVRQALNYAIDKKSIVKQIYLGTAVTTSQPFSTDSDAYLASLDNAYSYNPAKAKQLLAAAGYANGFTMNFPAPPQFDPALLASIKQNLADVGVTVNLQNIPPADLAPGIAKKSWPAEWIYVLQRSTWDDYQRMYAPNALYNPFNTTNPALDKFAAAYPAATTAAARKTLAQNLNKELVQQAWSVPIARFQQTWFTDKGTKIVNSPTFRPSPDIYAFEPAN